MASTLHDNLNAVPLRMDDDGVLAIGNYRLANPLIKFTDTEVPRQAR
jgi:hypothetical protein